jgi:hypothetical protein
MQKKHATYEELQNSGGKFVVESKKIEYWIDRFRIPMDPADAHALWILWDTEYSQVSFPLAKSVYFLDLNDRWNLIQLNRKHVWQNMPPDENLLQIMAENGDEIYVIFTLDICQDSNMTFYDLLPRNHILRKHLTLTESDDYDDSYGDDLILRHRKYAGIVPVKELCEVLNDNPVNFESTCQTMGSLTEIGWLPAVSLSGGGNDYGDYSRHQTWLSNMYVSPLFNVKNVYNDNHAIWLWESFELAIENFF